MTMLDHPLRGMPGPTPTGRHHAILGGAIQVVSLGFLAVIAGPAFVASRAGIPLGFDRARSPFDGSADVTGAQWFLLLLGFGLGVAVWLGGRYLGQRVSQFFARRR
jgi:hypothetical protein